MQLTIRDERPADHPTVRAVHVAAFPGPEEAELVDAVRVDADPIISLIAEHDGGVVGHVLFSPVTIAGADEPLRFGLAPVGVVPAEQGRGIGAALIEAGIARCRELGAVGIVLLGEPEYYSRFGFVAASTFGLVYELIGQHPAFQALELTEGGFEPGGRVDYHPAFDQV